MPNEIKSERERDSKGEKGRERERKGGKERGEILQKKLFFEIQERK